VFGGRRLSTFLEPACHRPRQSCRLRHSLRIADAWRSHELARLPATFPLRRNPHSQSGVSSRSHAGSPSLPKPARAFELVMSMPPCSRALGPKSHRKTCAIGARRSTLYRAGIARDFTPSLDMLTMMYRPVSFARVCRALRPSTAACIVIARSALPPTPSERGGAQ
jgi:hypothetical protein